jgi:hypothetical protein
MPTKYSTIDREIAAKEEKVLLLIFRFQNF